MLKLLDIGLNKLICILNHTYNSLAYLTKLSMGYLGLSLFLET